MRARRCSPRPSRGACATATPCASRTNTARLGFHARSRRHRGRHAQERRRQAPWRRSLAVRVDPDATLEVPVYVTTRPDATPATSTPITFAAVDAHTGERTTVGDHFSLPDSRRHEAQGRRTAWRLRCRRQWSARRARRPARRTPRMACRPDTWRVLFRDVRRQPRAYVFRPPYAARLGARKPL